MFGNPAFLTREDVNDADSEIESIQAWKKTYQIEPLTVPPIQLQSPTAEVMLGSFSQKKFTRAN